MLGAIRVQPGPSGRRPLRILLVALIWSLGSSIPSRALGAQMHTVYVGESVSRGVLFEIVCLPECVDAVWRSPRSVTSAIVGVERRFFADRYSHLLLGAAASRRGFWTGSWLNMRTLSLPVLGVVEPWPDAPLGLAAAAGVTWDVSLDRASDSRLGVSGGLWASARLGARHRLLLGVRGTRAMRPNQEIYIRSRVLFLGLSSGAK